MATKLPSGSYRTQVFVGYERGKRQYKSFVAETAKKADLLALEYQAEHPFTSGKTLGRCLDTYIRAKRPVLSPSTIRGYVSMQIRLNADFPRLMGQKLHSVTADDIQSLINTLYQDSKPKTVRNYYGLLSAVFKSNGMTVPSCTMPRKIRPELNIPDEDTIKRLYKAAEGTALEVPILLASIGAMRRGEIVAATMDDIKDGYLHVHRAAALDEHQRQVVKEYPKTEGSDRYILLPDAVIKKIEEQGCVCAVGLTYISTMFPRLLRKVGIEHFRFHDLRHAFVSIAHAAGLPDAYVMERGGWSSSYTMTNVYRHTLSGDRKRQEEKVNEVFNALL